MTKQKYRQLLGNFSIALAIILIWRGIWYMLDMLDLYVLNNDHVLTSVGGVIVGLLILYLPDKDLKELGKL